MIVILKIMAYVLFCLFCYSICLAKTIYFTRTKKFCNCPVCYGEHKFNIGWDVFITLFICFIPIVNVLFAMFNIVLIVIPLVSPILEKIEDKINKFLTK